MNIAEKVRHEIANANGRLRIFFDNSLAKMDLFSEVTYIQGGYILWKPNKSGNAINCRLYRNNGKLVMTSSIELSYGEPPHVAVNRYAREQYLA